MARFLYSMPGSTVGSRRVDAPPVPYKVRGAYRNDVRSLLRLSNRTDADGKSRAHTLHLSSDAHDALISFSRWLEPQLAEGARLSSVADWAGKLAGAVARLAGILHMSTRARVEAPWKEPIAGTTMENAKAIGRYLIPHAKAAFSEMGMDPRVQAARHVLRWIKHNGVEPFSKQQAWQGTRGRFREVCKLDEALTVLEEHSWIRKCPKEPRKGPGRPAAPDYEVNPAVASYNP